MKKIILLFLCCILLKIAHSQDITPLRTSEQCPGVNITFTVIIAAQSIQSVQPKALNVNPVVVQQPYNVTSSGGNITFNFIGRFADYNNKQTFTVYYTNSNNQALTYDFTFPKIKSLLTANSYSQINPNIANFDAPRCQITTRTISFTNVQYGNPWETPAIGYGTVTNYEYLLPTGWSLNGVPSTGSWMASNNNVTVTSDLASGVGSSIRIRPVNTQCATGLVAGQEATIAINRPAPSLYISGTSHTICSGCQTFTINGMPSGATVQWSLSGTDASISGCSTCTSVSVCRNSSVNTTVNLTATVSHCTFTYSEQFSLILGNPPIPTIQYVSYYGNDVGLTALYIPDATYNWYEGGVLTEAGGSNIYLTTVPCNTTKFIQAEAVNACGTSIKAGKGVSVKCSTGGAYSLAPNPASSNLTISVNESVDKTNTLTTEIQEVRITDKLGNLKIINKYLKGTKSVNINLASFKSDVYVVQIYNGKEWDSQQLVIQH